MNSTDQQGTGGATIKSRPSIHSHSGCIFAQGERMVRYGLHCNHRENADSDNERGADEVDNIISKPAYPIRPPSRQQNYCRRKSLDAANISTAYNDDALSKSVPATLPSQLYSSQSISDDEQENVVENRFSDVSFQSIATPNRSNVSRNTSNTSNSTPTFRLESARNSEREKLERDQSSSKALIYLIGVIVVVCAVCASGFNVGHISNKGTSIYDEFRFNTDLSGLGEKYNIDENSILKVQTGISTIFEKEDTGSFVFVYDSNDINFNPSEFNEFINDISLAASKYLRNESTPLHYTSVEGSKLEMSEHSELLCRYRDEVAASGLLLVRHVEAVPARLALAFHYYCDEYNPLVKKSAIFFTLNVATCPQPEKKKTYSMIEKCLAEKWKDVPADSIGPLLTRVVSVVVDVTSVF